MCVVDTDIYSPDQFKERKLNGAYTSNVYYFTSACMCVCRISNMKSPGIVGVNYTESESAQKTQLKLCGSIPPLRSLYFHYKPVGKCYASIKPLGNLNLLFFFLQKPAKWDLLGLFWVCWRIIFPCAVFGRETASKSAAKPTWAEPNWWDSSLLQCSVIPNDTTVCLSPSFSFRMSASLPRCDLSPLD